MFRNNFNNFIFGVIGKTMVYSRYFQIYSLPSFYFIYIMLHDEII